MKITYCEKPFFTEHQLFSKPEKFLAAIKECGFVNVNTMFRTKTRIYVSIGLPGFSYSVNWKIDGIKTHEESEMNFLSGERTIQNYFKIMKAQKIETFENYISTIVMSFVKDDTIEIKIFETDVIKKLKEA